MSTQDSMLARLELEQWLRLFDNSDFSLLVNFINEKAENFKVEALRLIRDSKCDESKVALAKHDALIGVSSAIRQRMQMLKEEIKKGNNE